MTEMTIRNLIINYFTPEVEENQTPNCCYVFIAVPACQCIVFSENTYSQIGLTN